MADEKTLWLSFAGSVTLHPETLMQYCGEDESKPQIITVAQYAELSDDEQSNYMLEDAIAAIRDGEDVNYVELSICED